MEEAHESKSDRWSINYNMPASDSQQFTIASYCSTMGAQVSHLGVCLLPSLELHMKINISILKGALCQKVKARLREIGSQNQYEKFNTEQCILSGYCKFSRGDFVLKCVCIYIINLFL